MGGTPGGMGQWAVPTSSTNPIDKANATGDPSSYPAWATAVSTDMVKPDQTPAAPAAASADPKVQEPIANLGFPSASNPMNPTPMTFDAAPVQDLSSVTAASAQATPSA